MEVYNRFTSPAMVQANTEETAELFGNVAASVQCRDRVRDGVESAVVKYAHC